MALPPEKSSAKAQLEEWKRNVPSHEAYTKGDFAIEHVLWLDSTVRNSGWIEVLASSCHGYLDDIITSLNAMGVPETLAILQRCLNLFPTGKLPDREDERSKLIEALSDEDFDLLDELNHEYYASQEDLCALVMQYWESTRRK